MSPYLFLAIFVTVLALVNTYVYRRFFRRLHLPPRTLTLLKYFAVALTVMEALYALTFRSDVVTQPVYYVLSLSIGFSFILFVAALGYDLARLTFRKVPFHPDRRRALKIFFDAAMMAGVAAYMAAGLIGGRRPPLLKEVEVFIKDFPFDGFTIVQLSDVHVGNTLRRPFVERLVQRVNALSPDLVAITGDLVDKEVDLVAEDLAPLADLHSVHGTYFSFGNHEYFHGPDAIAAHLETLGITVLEDRTVRIGKGRNFFNLTGLRDWVGHRMKTKIPNPQEAFKEIDATRPTIALAHQPVQVTSFESYPVDLVLSGHTHGGQIFPFGFLVRLAQPYLAGLHLHTERMQVYVSRGTGFWGPPIRIFAPAEMTKITIRSV